MYNNQFGFNNPYFQPVNGGIQPPLQNTQNSINNVPPVTNNKTTLLGKSVDSIDVVKAMDIPLDGSISYFPLTNGSAIVTKQLLNDGTSKTTIYKPVEEKDVPKVQYATIEDVQKSIKEIDFTDTIDDLKDEIKDLKNKIKKMKKGD